MKVRINSNERRINSTKIEICLITTKQKNGKKTKRLRVSQKKADRQRRPRLGMIMGVIGV